MLLMINQPRGRYTLTAEVGSYALSGTDSDFRYFSLSVDSGSYSLLFSKFLVGNAGSYSLNGTSVTLLKGFNVSGDVGSYSINGNSVGLIITRLLNIESGNYLLNGTNANIDTKKYLFANVGSYILTGNDAYFGITGIGTGIKTYIPTYHQELGLSIIAFASLAEGGWQVAELNSNISSYSHSITANGGFDTMNVSIADDRISMDEWIERGVGRHIQVFNSAGNICWEGFVNSVDAKLGAQSITIGPLMDVGNRVSVSYAEITSLDPFIVGQDTITTIAENVNSQDKYGVIEKVLSGGRLTSTEANLIRDTFLKERAFPETSSEITIGGGSGQPTLTLNCLGYWYWTNAYVFNDTGITTVTVDNRIAQIIGSNPNTDMYLSASIQTNNSIVPEYTNEDKLAMAHLKELLALGGANDQRYTLGCYENREFIYREIPDTPKYKTSLSDQGQRILTYEGALVYPWDVRPAQWLFVSDSLIGRYTDTTNYYEDPRYMFIEKVTYNIPWNISLIGSRVGTYDQLLAKMGLGDF